MDPIYIILYAIIGIGVLFIGFLGVMVYMALSLRGINYATVQSSGYLKSMRNAAYSVANTLPIVTINGEEWSRIDPTEISKGANPGYVQTQGSIQSAIPGGTTITVVPPTPLPRDDGEQ